MQDVTMQFTVVSLFILRGARVGETVFVKGAMGGDCNGKGRVIFKLLVVVVAGEGEIPQGAPLRLQE